MPSARPPMISDMDHKASALERAFTIAKSGECASTDAIKQKLRAEGYEIAQITGRTLSKQLLALIRSARGG
jgi:hypothetical protein